MIEASDLTKQFDRCTAVNHLSLTVHPGEILALLGPNGAGKTTTTRMLAGILRPTEGGARVGGFDLLTQTGQVRSIVGVLTEQHGLYNRMRCGEYLDFYGALYSLPAVERRTRADRLLEELDLRVDSDQWLAEFSKGMRQRLSLVRALLHSPQVLLLDEPTSALDPASARLVRNHLRGLRDAGITILICTHNLSEVEELADRIAIIRRGVLTAAGTAAELRRRLLGDPLFEIRLAAPLEDPRAALDGLVEPREATAGRLTFRTADPTAVNPEVIRRLAARGAAVIELREITPSLEAVYLRAVAEDEPGPAGKEAA
jgi:ABC-2 type transport system ATP-binding protein